MAETGNSLLIACFQRCTPLSCRCVSILRL